MLLLFYNIAHIGDLFEIQQIILNIIYCNPDKNIKFYTNYNHFILNDISNNFLIPPDAYSLPEVHNFRQRLVNLFYENPLLNYRKVTLNDNTEFVIINTCLMRLHRFKHVHEMDPISFQESYIMQLDEIRETLGIDIKYTKLSIPKLLPYLPNTNIDLFLEWKRTNTQQTLFYFNYLPQSNQINPCKTMEDHEEVILHLTTINPNLIILVPTFSERIKGIRNVISCEESFNCVEVVSCENIYKLNKILIECDYSIHFDIGACMTYMNREFFSRKNKLYHIHNPTQDYFKTISSLLKQIGSIEQLYEIPCNTVQEIKDYFSTPLSQKLHRNQGYGSSFNNLYLFEDKIKKEAKNEYGITKIQKEILFYKYVQKNKCLPMPEFIESTNSSYTMQYLNNYKPLFTIFPSFTGEQKQNILRRIQNHLEHLHDSSTQIVSKTVYANYLQMEMIDKLVKRYDEVKQIIQEYSFIKTVNNIPIFSFENRLNLLCEKIKQFLSTKIYYFLNPIHGDCQFNNILFNEETGHIVFIDPRGYFGDSDVFGPIEYDLAKVKFALSGYDAFDARNVTGLDISGSNITLDIPTLVPSPLVKNDFISQLVVSIWMGNAHCFKDNKFKTAYSYFIAMYYASLYL